MFEELDLALEAVKSRGDVADASEVSDLQQMFRDPRWQAIAKVRYNIQGLLDTVSVFICLLSTCVCLCEGSGELKRNMLYSVTICRNVVCCSHVL